MCHLQPYQPVDEKVRLVIAKLHWPKMPPTEKKISTPASQPPKHADVPSSQISRRDDFATTEPKEALK